MSDRDGTDNVVDFPNLNEKSVREIILQHARRGAKCTYKGITDQLSLDWSPVLFKPLWNILCNISETEYHDQRPLLTAIVVRGDDGCGKGFFELARRNGIDVDDEDQFEEDEQRRVFVYWSDK